MLGWYDKFFFIIFSLARLADPIMFFSLLLCLRAVEIIGFCSRNADLTFLAIQFIGRQYSVEYCVLTKKQNVDIYSLIG